MSCNAFLLINFEGSQLRQMIVDKVHAQNIQTRNTVSLFRPEIQRKNNHMIDYRHAMKINPSIYSPIVVPLLSFVIFCQQTVTRKQSPLIFQHLNNLMKLNAVKIDYVFN